MSKFSDPVYFCIVFTVVSPLICVLCFGNKPKAYIEIEQEKNRGQYERMTYDKVIKADHRSEAKRSFSECMKNADTETSQDFCLRVYEIEIE